MRPYSAKLKRGERQHPIGIQLIRGTLVMARSYTQAELEAFLEGSLSPEESASIEKQLRDDKEMLTELASVNGRKDAGLHSLGAIWRRHRIGCPTREQLGSFLLGTLEESLQEYVHFHIERVGCSFCQANLDDMKQRHNEANEARATRRRKYFDSSAGYVKGQ